MSSLRGADQNLQGKPDPQIAKVCKQEQRVLVTLDKGYSIPKKLTPSTGSLSKLCDITDWEDEEFYTKYSVQLTK